jgi:hypothetical protein
VPNPDDPTYWSARFSIGPNTLVAPPRSGRQHNLVSLLMKRTALSGPPNNDYKQVDFQRRLTGEDKDHCLVSAVVAKIEDGNIIAAIRIIMPYDQPAEDNIQMLLGLRERHPCAAPNRQPLSDPTMFSAANFTDEDSIAAVHSFPAGSSGDPDSIWSQHFRDPVANREIGTQLISSLTASVNILMEGQWPPTVVPTLF